VGPREQKEIQVVTQSPIIRTATADEAEALEALISAHREEGHLLPRTLPDLRAHAPRFLVVDVAGAIAACGELAPLSHNVAEIRSLVVDRQHRRLGLGSRLVAALERRARLHGYLRLCAFTHRPDHFLKLGFSMVPHNWLPEKIAADCLSCPLFKRCGQHAMLRTLLPIGVARKPALRPLESLGVVPSSVEGRPAQGDPEPVRRVVGAAV
jgi:amino-acid N-acetyltransferase